jgi:hypothetical protein
MFTIDRFTSEPIIVLAFYNVAVIVRPDINFMTLINVIYIELTVLLTLIYYSLLTLMYYSLLT